MARLAILLAAACLLGTCATARAQPRPAFSPYLNLTRQGANPALNYYGLVRPELQFRQSIQNLQGAVSTNQQALGELQGGAGGPAATGHPTQFLNYGGYFLNSGQTTGGIGSNRPGGTMQNIRSGMPGASGAGAAIAPRKR